MTVILVTFCFDIRCYNITCYIMTFIDNLRKNLCDTDFRARNADYNFVAVNGLEHDGGFARLQVVRVLVLSSKNLGGRN